MLISRPCFAHKFYQNAFGSQTPPGPAWELTGCTPPDSLAVFRGLLLREGESKENEETGKKGRGERREFCLSQILKASMVSGRVTIFYLLAT